MVKLSRFAAILVGWMAMAALPLANGETVLRVFAGGSQQRTDLARKMFDEFEKQNPGVKITLESGGATSELQRQYLSTLLGAKDSSLDVLILDIINPAQYYAAGWIEPLDKYLGVKDAKSYMSQYLPAYATADVIDNKIVALPYFADAMFLYYRKDLLDKYGVKPPATWDELATESEKIQKGENNPNLQGLSFQGAPIEGAVCTFLLPYWSQGKDYQKGVPLDKKAAITGLDMWLDMVDKGVAKKNIAEVKTGDTVNEFMAGNVVFAINWGFAWDLFQSDPHTTVKGKVGVAKLPAMPGGQSATCIGGWQWSVSAFSKNKAEAAKLVKFMSSPDVSKFMAINGSLLPVYAKVYSDSDVLKANPWYDFALPVVESAKSRPVSERYAEVSDVVRTQTSAALARVTKPEATVDEIDNRLRRVMR
ncbi:MAG TPA: ABC transporter substrate-binding protein [Casimicrobiaceae bacterium]|nr:ABC transporter substrate-binding protein [Casimicrobiaceae bacterium]